MGLFRTVSEINGNFIRKLQIFPTLRVFCAPAEGVSALGIKKKLELRIYRADKEV